MKLLQRISTTVCAALLSLTVLMGLVGAAQAQDTPMTPNITASISGVVYSTAGQPLADIEVKVLSRGQSNWWSTVSTTRTDAAGAYTFGYLNTGIYRLGFEDSRQEFLPVYHPNAAKVEEALDIPLAGVDVTGLQTTLRPTLHISGIVTDDSGQPLPDISVSVYRQDTYGQWSAARTVRSDTTGAYAVDHLHPATYRLGFRDERDLFIARFFPNAQDVENAQDIPVSDADVNGLQTSLQRSAQIAGVVTIWDGPQPSYATVTIYAPDGDQWKSVKRQDLYSYSNPAMHYEIVGLLPGRYRVGVTGSDYDGSITNTYEEFYDDATTIQEAADVLLEIADVLTDVNFVLGENPHLSNLSGVVTTPEGAGVPGVIVTAYISNTWGWDEIRGTSTITDGIYTLRALPAGDYVVRFDDPLRNFVSEFYENASRIGAATILSLTGGSNLSGINAALDPTGRIVVKVTMLDGQPLQYVEVKAYSAASGYSSEIVASKSVHAGFGQPVTVTLSGLFPGAYRLYIMARDENNAYSEYFDNALLLEGATDVSVLSGEVTEIHAVLGENPGYARIMGTVRSPESVPLANIKVTALYPTRYPLDYDFTPQQSTFTDQTGNYSLWALTPNTYIVQFTDPDGAYIRRYYGNATDQQGATRIQLESQQTVKGIDAVLPQTGMLTGTVSLYDGRPPVSGYVTLYRWRDYEWPYQGEWVPMEDRPVTAFYRFTQVPTGKYRVKVSASFGDGEYYDAKFFPDASSIDYAQDITVEDGMTTSNVNFVFGEDEHDSRIEGQVYAGGMALPGMQIDLYDSRHGNWWRLVYVLTDAAGAFRIDGLGAGTYRICVVDPAQVRETVCYPGAGAVEGASSLQLADGQVVSDLRIDMALFQHWTYLPIIGR
jgi:hypothetical protein